MTSPSIANYAGIKHLQAEGEEHLEHCSSIAIDNADHLTVIGVINHQTNFAPKSIEDAQKLARWLLLWVDAEIKKQPKPVGECIHCATDDWSPELSDGQLTGHMFCNGCKTVADEPEPAEPELTFTFERYNPRRRMRGAESIEFRVSESGEDDYLLWMSVHDVKMNALSFPDCFAELQKGLDAYNGKES